MYVAIPASTVALLREVRDALMAPPERGVKTLPRWLPNGEEITELKQLAAVLSVDEKTAAYVVLDSYQPPTELLAKAERRVRDAEFWGKPVGTVIRRGTRPSGHQLRLPNMPKLPSVSETDQERITQRQTDANKDIQRGVAHMYSLIQKRKELAESGDWKEYSKLDSYIWDQFGFDVTEAYGDISHALLIGDWTMFGGCRDIRNSAYSILGFKGDDNTADPHLHGGDPGWGGAAIPAHDPDVLAYALLDELKSADRSTIPMFRGVSLHGRDVEGFIEDLRTDNTFDLPLASFTGDEYNAKRFGTDVVFKVQVGARVMQGGYMGVPEEERVDRWGEPILIDEEELFQEPKYTELVTGGRFKVMNVRDVNGTTIVSIKQVAVFDPATGIAQKKANARWKYAYLFDDSLNAKERKPEAKDVVGADRSGGVMQPTGIGSAVNAPFQVGIGTGKPKRSQRRIIKYRQKTRTHAPQK